MRYNEVWVRGRKDLKAITSHLGGKGGGGCVGGVDGGGGAGRATAAGAACREILAQGLKYANFKDT